MAEQQPPFPFKNPVEGYLRLTADGRWLYKGEPITHEGLVFILESNFGPGPEGGWEVKLGPQRVVVEIEDVPYFVRDVDVNPEGTVVLQLNTGAREVLRPEGVRIGAGGGTYVRLKEGADARFKRQAEIRLGEFLEERDGRPGLRIGDRFTPVVMED